MRRRLTSPPEQPPHYSIVSHTRRHGKKTIADETKLTDRLKAMLEEERMLKKLRFGVLFRTAFMLFATAAAIPTAVHALKRYFENQTAPVWLLFGVIAMAISSVLIVTLVAAFHTLIQLNRD